MRLNKLSDSGSATTPKDKFITKEALIRIDDNYPSLIGKFIFGYRVYKAWMESSRTLKAAKAIQPGIRS